jgi:hypothetical protein
LIAMRMSAPAIAVPNQCIAAASGIGAPVGGGSFSVGGTTSTSAGVLTDVLYNGFIEQNGTATGTLRAQPGLGNPCAVRSATWAAQLRPGTTAPKGGASLAGASDRAAR